MYGKKSKGKLTKKQKEDDEKLKKSEEESYTH